MKTERYGDWVYHDVEPWEDWAQYGMEQPNPHFGHRVDWPHCPVCRRNG